MPTILTDPLSGRRIAVAPERARRGAPSSAPDAPDPAPCDFCEGHESATPPESDAVRPDSSAPDTAGWRARAVPNLYPATPVHEVVIHTPDHTARFEDVDAGHRRDVMTLYARRLAASGSVCTIAAMNRGRAAGASRTHDHGQIFGLEEVPPTVAAEVSAFDAEPCVLCALMDGPTRVTDGPVALAAHPVPLVAGEMLIAGGCSPTFLDADHADVGDAFADGIARVRRTLGDTVAFNLVVHTAPADTPTFHWHAHLYPRTATWGALEIGTGLVITAADPAATAEALRAAG